jgi:hypothetical protein
MPLHDVHGALGIESTLSGQRLRRFGPILFWDDGLYFGGIHSSGLRSNMSIIRFARSDLRPVPRVRSSSSISFNFTLMCGHCSVEIGKGARNS